MIEPVLIHPEALYDDGTLYQSLGLTSAALASARRAGTLRFTRKGKRTLYKGTWILAWLDSKADSLQVHPEAAGREGRHAS